ncbi:hypothetical protein BKA70DRAFT_301552 [Coprinopsis sp. MPI-PUGE-AT-0042]|nr:hypothetical protein BKA70DRAFT_301552 [Coprinopsis sp. MPI-PUGE-AT-0042]
MFQAFEMDNGWAFQHVQTKRYLGIPHTVVRLDDWVQLTSVPKPFTWMVVPHHRDGRKFQICLPFTSLLLGPQRGHRGDNLPLHLQTASEADWAWWTFEDSESPWPQPQTPPTRVEQEIRPDPALANKRASSREFVSLAGTSRSPTSPTPWAWSRLKGGPLHQRGPSYDTGGDDPHSFSSWRNRASTSRPTNSGHNRQPSQKRKLSLLPRSLPSPEIEQGPTSSFRMSEEDAKKKTDADHDVNELLELRDISKGERYITDLPAEYHHKLVDKLVSTAIESSNGEASAFVAQLFKRDSTRRLSSASTLEEGLGAVAEFLEDISVEFPLAYERFVVMAKGANLDSAALLRVWRKGNSSKLVGLLR